MALRHRLAPPETTTRTHAMKSTSILIGVLSAILLAGPAGISIARADRVYIGFKPGQKNAARGLVQQSGGKVHHEFDRLNAMATTLPNAALAGIRNNPNVEFIEDDPPRYLYGCSMPTEGVPYGLDDVQATDPSFDTQNGAGIKIGIIDTGLFTGHSDFAGVPMTGYPGGTYPTAWNTDRNGHGTHVTGTIAAALNGSGVVGVSPGVAIHMVKVFGDDGGWIYSSSLLNAAQQCQSAGCRIISMSLGGGTRSRTEETGFQNLYNAGILLVAAAGNAGNSTLSFPAGYGSVISVAAVDSASSVASFSQYNSDVELSGPGVGVLSTVPYCDENTVTAASTSVSGRHVEFSGRGTATAALVDGGLADAINSNWQGRIVLVERGSISFYDKVMNVQRSGGLACIIYNTVANEELYATLGSGNSSTIPAMGLTQAQGLLLKGLVGTTTTVNSAVNFETSGWDVYSGTSMATPHVSAVAALIWSAAPTKSNANIRSALNATALDLGAAGRDASYGYGLVQAKAALDYLAPPGGDLQAPVISNVSSAIVNSKKGTFKITWNTDEPSTTVVILNGNRYPNTSMVTSHSMTFQGSKGVRYTYSVESADAAQNVATAGPLTHQN